MTDGPASAARFVREKIDGARRIARRKLRGLYRAKLRLPWVDKTPPGAIAVWGNSLVEGFGDVVPGGWPTRLARTMPGRAIYNGGVGGEAAEQIVNRLLAAPVLGLRWTLVLDLARNDVGTSNMIPAVMAQIDRVRAARPADAPLIVATCTPAMNEPATSPEGRQIAAFNAALKARGDVVVLDTFATLVDRSDGTISQGRMFDRVHWGTEAHRRVAEATRALLVSEGL